MKTIFTALLITLLSFSLKAEEWITPYQGPESVPYTNSDKVWYEPSSNKGGTYENFWTRTKKIDPSIQNGKLPPMHGAKYPNHPDIAPYAGHYNQSQTEGTFRWGWFGAEHFYPQVRWHKGYNGEVYRWSHQRRY